MKTTLTRRQVNELAFKKERKRIGKIKDLRPARNPDYLDFIRSQPCCVCRRLHGVEAAHTGSHGIGQKSSDMDAIPLCGVSCHREGRESYHKLGKSFFARHGLKLVELIARYNRLYAVLEGDI